MRSQQPFVVLFRGVAFSLAALALLALAGCGRDGPPRYRLSGKVTHGGKPIPAGSVTFIPDAAQGNKGMAASVEIVNGQYDTKEKGHVGGPHLVKITALDGQGSNEFPRGLPLFPDYELKFDLSKQESTKDLEVPAEWVAPRTAPVTNHGA
jgi:hypothetical protein